MHSLFYGVLFMEVVNVYIQGFVSYTAVSIGLLVAIDCSKMRCKENILPQEKQAFKRKALI